MFKNEIDAIAFETHTSEISLKPENELTDLQLETISGGGGKGTSETVSGKGSGTVSGPTGVAHLN